MLMVRVKLVFTVNKEEIWMQKSPHSAPSPFNLFHEVLEYLKGDYTDLCLDMQSLLLVR